MRLGKLHPVGVVLVSLMLAPRSLWACAACFGRSDSAMAAGMNWGILSLLGVIGLVLLSVAGFFVFLIRRSAASAQTSKADQVLQSWQANWPVSQETAAPLGLEAPARGGFRRGPALAERRKHCAHTASGSMASAGARSRG